MLCIIAGSEKVGHANFSQKEERKNSRSNAVKFDFLGTLQYMHFPLTMSSVRTCPVQLQQS
jgi:hypothetical protein